MAQLASFPSLLSGFKADVQATASMRKSPAGTVLRRKLFLNLDYDLFLLRHIPAQHYHTEGPRVTDITTVAAYFASCSLFVFQEHREWGDLASHAIAEYFAGPCDDLEAFIEDHDAVWQVSGSGVFLLYILHICNLIKKCH